MKCADQHCQFVTAFKRSEQNASLKFKLYAFVTSAKKVMLSSMQLVSLSICQQDYAKTTQSIFKQFGGKIVRTDVRLSCHNKRILEEIKKKATTTTTLLLDFSGNHYYQISVVIRIALPQRQGQRMVRVTVRWDHRHTPHGTVVTRCLFNGNNFATSAEVCALVLFQLHCALSLAAQCIVIGPVCLCVCGFVGLLVCYHDNSKLRASIFTKLGQQVKVVTISS